MSRRRRRSSRRRPVAVVRPSVRPSPVRPDVHGWPPGGNRGQLPRTSLSEGQATCEGKFVLQVVSDRRAMPVAVSDSEKSARDPGVRCASWKGQLGVTLPSQLQYRAVRRSQAVRKKDALICQQQVDKIGLFHEIAN